MSGDRPLVEAWGVRYRSGPLADASSRDDDRAAWADRVAGGHPSLSLVPLIAADRLTERDTIAAVMESLFRSTGYTIDPGPILAALRAHLESS